MNFMEIEKGFLCKGQIIKACYDQNDSTGIHISPHGVNILSKMIQDHVQSISVSKKRTISAASMSPLGGTSKQGRVEEDEQEI